MASVADIVIIVNKTNMDAINEGLLGENFNSENILFAASLIEARIKLKEIAKEGDVILFENDLPDNYR